MEPQAVFFRFPNRTEIRYLDVLPEIGERVWCDGTSYRVASVETGSQLKVNCVLAPEDDVSQRSPEGAGVPFASPGSGGEGGTGPSDAEDLQKRLETLELDRIAWALPSSSAEDLHPVPDEDWPGGSAA
jgi:hypothetical protein